MQQKPETVSIAIMQSATLLVVLTLASYSTGTAVQLSCNSQLRLVLPDLFAHCSCSYSEWSAWEAVPNSVVRVPTSQCRSNESYSETRTQSAIGQGCRSRTQTRSVCKYTILSASPYPTGTLLYCPCTIPEKRKKIDKHALKKDHAASSRICPTLCY